MASFAAALASCAVALAWGQRFWPVTLPIGTAARVTAACAVMATVVRAVPGGLAGQVLAGAASYGVVAVALDVLGLRSQLGRDGAEWLLQLRSRIQARHEA